MGNTEVIKKPCIEEIKGPRIIHYAGQYTDEYIEKNKKANRFSCKVHEKKRIGGQRWELRKHIRRCRKYKTM